MTKTANAIDAYADAIEDARIDHRMSESDIRKCTQIGEILARTAQQVAVIANSMDEGRVDLTSGHLGRTDYKTFSAYDLALYMTECEFDWIAGFGVIRASAKLGLRSATQLDQSIAQASSDDIETVIAARGMGIGF